MRKRNLKYNQRSLVILLALLLVLVLVVAWVVMQHSKKTSGHTVTPSPSGKTSTNDTSTHAGPTHDTTPSPTTLPSNPSHPASSTLPKPTGQILSASHGSVPMSANESSTCISVMGASCYIQATMNGKVVVLTATKTITDDQQGVAFDPWPVSKLSPGTWSVQAVANKDGQKALSDPWTLTVTQ